MAVPLLGDAVFTVYDGVAAGSDERSNGWLITQSIFTTPQAVFLGLGPHFVGPDELPLGIQIWLTQLSAFSIYGLASPRVSMPTLYGISWALGADLAITNQVAALSLQRRFSPPTQAITSIVASVPQLVVAGYALASPDSVPRQRAAVLALGGWSSALLLHGAASLVWYRPAPPVKPEQAIQLGPSMLQGARGLVPGLVASGVL